MEDKNYLFLTDLYMKYYPQLFQRAYRSIGDPEKAQELVQDVFLVALRQINVLYDHPCPVGWLHKTLSNLLLQEKKRPVWQQLPPDDELPASAGMELQSGFSTLMPSGLSDEERDLLYWRFVEDLTYDEIGDRLGITSSAAGMRLLRAKKHCRELLSNAK